MNATIPVVTASRVQQTSIAVSNFRIIPRLETNPAIVAIVQTALGKAALLATFAMGMYFFYRNPLADLLTILPFAIITFLPEYRRFVLVITPLVLLMLSRNNPLLLGTTFSVVAIGMLLYVCVMRWPSSLFSRRPIAFLLSGFSVLIVIACGIPPDSLAYSTLWCVVGVMASYVWFIAYALTDRGSKLSRDWTLELATLRPLWGSTNTPFPKGAAYLRRIEAKTSEQLAVIQIKGLKLLVWAVLLSLIQHYWIWFFHLHLRIPTAAEALAMSVRGTPVPWHLRWGSQILFFFEMTLSTAIMGHRIICMCRLAGFNALRNTYRPLSSTTIVDFFNRFYYYFKELLVDFFYYPAFFRYWKTHPKFRITFATFAAVFFGNSLYHLTRDWQYLKDNGLLKGLASYQVLLFDNAVLAAAISISQFRRRRAKLSGFLRGQLIPSCGVAVFYILLGVFMDESRAFTLPQTFKYFLSLFFINL